MRRSIVTSHQQATLSATLAETGHLIQARILALEILEARAERARLCELRARFDVLTPRERDVLRRVVQQGRLNKQIAAEPNINERTVKLHRTAITTKLEVRSVADLTRLVQAAGALEEPLRTLP